jgi:hypothetical protein
MREMLTTSHSITLEVVDGESGSARIGGHTDTSSVALRDIVYVKSGEDRMRSNDLRTKHRHQGE